MASETVEERLAKLERNARWYRLVLAGLGVAVLACAVTWVVRGTTGRARVYESTESGTVTRARGLILADENGTPRAALTGDEDGPVLWLQDERAKVRAMLIMPEGGLSLCLTNERGEVRVGLGISEDRGWLNLYDEKGKVIWRSP